MSATLRKRKTPPPSPPEKPKPKPKPRPPPRLEFRALSDGAWYGARVAVQRGALRVMYEEFTEEHDEWYEPAAAGLDVAALRARFRAASLALDDARCRDLRPGAPLCVSLEIDRGVVKELKYYDAVLHSVSPATHETVDGEERCACRFTVRWTEGSRSGSMEDVGVGRVCCVQSSPVQDPVLTEFLDGVTKLLGNGNRTASQAIDSVAADGGVWDVPPGFQRK
ncbi:hypothetical protein EJB05_35345, partial [Eragrostis curvula]